MTGDSPSPQQPTQEALLAADRLCRAIQHPNDRERVAYALDRFAAQRVTAAPVSGAPTDDELEALIKPLWMAAKPSHEAQSIRARLSAAFDDPKYRQWVSDFIPDYVWSLVDIAAQRGMTAATDKARREALTGAEKWHWQRYIELRDESPRSREGLVSGIAGAHMAAHRESAEYFHTLTPQNPGDAAPESE